MIAVNVSLLWYVERMDSVPRLTVGIFIFDGVEVLDFAGPFEVFSRTRLVPGAESRRSDESAPFDVITIARTRDPVTATGGLQVIPHYAWNAAPPIDILVIPGGFGTRPLLDDALTIDWIVRSAAGAKQVTSVCTGALLLARAGLLAGRRATTHWAALDLLASLDPSIEVIRDARVVHDGIVTSAGVSAGIDMALQVVERCCTAAVAHETAHYIEYTRTPAASPDGAELYLVVERFKAGAPAVYQRFAERGRMAPEGLSYVSSWVDEKLERCYQLMKTQDRGLLEQWIANWNDIVDFEVVRVMPSREAAERVRAS
jgi:transcriptional regulator GlxA family with amidase domain